MSGPRVTSGKGSKQDYQTPQDLLDPVENRFGLIIADLAAHRLNRIHPVYFAPEYFTDTWEPDKMDAMDMVRSLVGRGARHGEAHDAVYAARGKAQLKVRNYDSAAYAFDAFASDWSALRSQNSGNPDARLLWLNCEFNNVGPWATKCRSEAQRGANILLLTPMVITEWYTQHIAGKADVYQLANRVCFDGKHPFPKDCMISHFHPGAKGKLAIWDWKKDIILEQWKMEVGL